MPSESAPGLPAAGNNSATPQRVLSVGQCGFDDSRLARLLGELGLTMDRATDATDASGLLAANRYTLVLVNRVFDADGSSGLALLTRIAATVPTMLVSDLPEAQAQAIAAGALPGFGKSQLHAPRTRECCVSIEMTPRCLNRSVTPW